MMKPTLTFALVLLFGSALLGGCRSNSTSPNSNNNNNNNIPSGMTATINGKAWSGQVVGFRHTGPLSNLQFEGWVTTPFQQIPFGVSPSITGPGTYPLVQNDQTSGNIVEGAYNTDTSSYSDNVTGSMTIMVLTDNNIQGTFHFTAIGAPNGDTVTITNGQFNVPLR